LTLTNVTVSGNTAYYGGGGIYVYSGDVRLHNTIVANNVRGTAAPVDDDVYGYGTLEASSSYNLIGDAGSAGGLIDGVNGNIVGADPLLGPLADNGGPTLTHALLPGSPAIDAGSDAKANEAGLTRDQRGYGRFGDGDQDATPTVDIGAFELILMGDANGDGAVDGGDYTLWADHYNQAGGWGEGDFSGNGFVDGGDYTLWADNYGAEVGGAEALPAAAYDAGDRSPGVPAGMLAFAALPRGRSPAGDALPLSDSAGAGEGRVTQLAAELAGATLAAGASQEAEQLPEGSGGRKGSGLSAYARLGRKLPAVEAELNLLEEPDLTVLASAI